MQCEICNIIEKLGLDSSALDIWFCSADKPMVRKDSLRTTLQILALKAALLHRVARGALIHCLTNVTGAGIHNRRAYRQHYITLGL